MAKGRDLSPDQISSTTFRNCGCNSHMVWKRKGIFVTLDLLPKSSIKTGQWSENVLGRWVTVASGYNILQLGLTKHLSILSRMRLVTGLLLVHVYFGPTKPKSKKLIGISFYFILFLFLMRGSIVHNNKLTRKINPWPKSI